MLFLSHFIRYFTFFKICDTLLVRYFYDTAPERADLLNTNKWGYFFHSLLV